jgi:uncharacterized repeat protein (TIGR03806 family)
MFLKRRNLKSLFACATSVIAILCGGGFPSHLAAKEISRPYGMDSRPVAPAYLFMPQNDAGHFPALLSQTGAFKDVAQDVPADGLIPYDINISFWSDGATKRRWMALPQNNGAQIGFSPTGEWTFPNGTIFVKEFDLATNETHPELKRRLETRLLVRDSLGGVYGATYKWRPDNRDADLLLTNLSETIAITTPAGTRMQTWYYPSRQDCRACHLPNAGLVLGVKTRQLNRDFTFPSGVTDNEIRAWNHAGIFNPAIAEADLPQLPRLAPADDETRSLPDRARSYLDVNCAQCHRPNGVVAYFDARYDTPLRRQELIDGPVLFDQGIDHAHVITPNDIWRSILYLRVNTLEGLRMPPLAHQVLDEKSIALLRDWIQSLGGPPVLEPPIISPVGGNFAKPIAVTIRDREPGVEIFYTLDGSVPTKSDLPYEKPIRIAGPTTLRARAYKGGFIRSTASLQTFIVGD